jgi:hypothetical protein
MRFWRFVSVFFFSSRGLVTFSRGGNTTLMLGLLLLFLYQKIKFEGRRKIELYYDPIGFHCHLLMPPLRQNKYTNNRYANQKNANGEQKKKVNLQVEKILPRMRLICFCKTYFGG